MELEIENGNGDGNRKWSSIMDVDDVATVRIQSNQVIDQLKVTQAGYR